MDLSTVFNSNGPMGMLSGVLQNSFNMSASTANVVAPIAGMVVAGIVDSMGAGGWASTAMGSAIGLEILNNLFPNALPTISNTVTNTINRIRSPGT